MAPKPDGIPATYSVVLPEQVKAFPEYLRKAGYYTSNNQKQDYQFEAPVTVWDENGPAASFRNRPAGKPFFSVFNFFLTHESMVALRKDPLRVDPAQSPCRRSFRTRLRCGATSPACTRISG